MANRPHLTVVSEATAGARRAVDDEHLKSGGGGGTFDGMGTADLHNRLSKLEGGFSTQQWAVSLVSAILIGGMALLWSDVGRVEDKVDALPSEIRDELQALNNSTLEAIRAGREFSQQPQPPVIVVPQSPGQTSPLLSPGTAEWPGKVNSLPDAQLGPAIIEQN